VYAITGRTAVTPRRQSNRHHDTSEEPEKPTSTIAMSSARKRGVSTHSSKMQVETNESSLLLRTQSRSSQMAGDIVDKTITQLITPHHNNSEDYSSLVKQIVDEHALVSEQLELPEFAEMPEDLNANRMITMPITPPEIARTSNSSILIRTPPRRTATEKQPTAPITPLTPTRHSQRLQMKEEGKVHATAMEVEELASQRRSEMSKKPINMMENVDKPMVRTPTRVRRKSEGFVTADAEAVATGEIQELQLTPRRSSRLTSRSENELEVVPSPSRSTRQSVKKIDAKGSEFSRRRVSQTFFFNYR